MPIRTRIRGEFISVTTTVFGLLLIGAWAGVRTLAWGTRRARISAFLALIPVAGTTIWYLTGEFHDLWPAWVDHPTLFAVWNLQDYGIAFLGLALLLAALLVPLWSRLATRGYGLLLVILAGSGYQSIWGEAAGSQTLWEPDRAALALKVLYTPAELEHGLVVGDKLAPLFRTSFYLRNNAAVKRLREHSVVDVPHLAYDAKWVLTYGEYRLNGGWEPRREAACRRDSVPPCASGMIRASFHQEGSATIPLRLCGRSTSRNRSGRSGGTARSIQRTSPAPRRLKNRGKYSSV